MNTYYQLVSQEELISRLKTGQITPEQLMEILPQTVKSQRH